MTRENNDADIRIARLSQEVLDAARNRLLVNLRYMDAALSFLSRSSYDGFISTDGRALFYGPVSVLRTYRDSKEELTRSFLHTVLHCVFMHPFTAAGIGESERRFWDLACDIAVASVICELGLPCTRTDREAGQKDMLRKIRGETGFLTAEKIFASLRNGTEGTVLTDLFSELEILFAGDDHSMWYAAADLPAGQAVSDGTVLQLPPDAEETADKWKHIAEKMEMEVETFAKVKGKYASSLVQNLRSVNREHYDYDGFLRKFAAVNETVRVSDDEFDYIYYSYGLRHYHNMPLIEPLEYREDRKIKDFVIAIDTSGSVAGEEVQAFIQKTYSILKSRESFDRKVNVHILQCDAKVQSDAVITCDADLERYMSTMEIKGLGGTDFRPVFDHVDALLREGEFSDLKGIIYFTDGLGTYPAHRPPCKTAFVFIENGYNVPEVPVWAKKVVLSPEEL